MSKTHYLSSTYIKLLVQANQELIRDIEQALGKPLKALLNEPFVDSLTVKKLISLFHKFGLDSWVLRHNNLLGISSHGPLGFAVLTAPNLELAIQIAADYSVIRTSYYECEFKHTDNRAEFSFTSREASPLISQWMIECGIYVVKQLVETIVAHPLGNNAHIQFQHSKPIYETELAAFYGIQCKFNQPVNSISIPSSWCEISSPLSEPATFNSNLRKCIELKQQLAGQHDIVKTTHQVLNNYFKELSLAPDTGLEMPNLKSLARDNHMTERTFARHLAKHNSSYRKIIESVRQQHACNLLKNTHLSISDISARLGYQETANFIRAFKTWLSCTPSQWRRQNA